jgi:hypothetical protein
MKGIHYAAIAILCFMAFTIAQCNRAHAQSLSVMALMPCTETGVVLELLKGRYNEIAIGGGLNKKGEQVRLFVSDATWTIILTNPAGYSCISQSGENWITAPLEIKGEKS